MIKLPVLRGGSRFLINSLT